MKARPALALAALLLLLPPLLLWPLPRVGGQALLAAPGFEASSHVWGLWAATRTHQPLLIHTDLLAFPDGVSLVLVDPLNLPAFALGQALGGPALGFNLVAWAGLAVAGIAGALLAREVDGPPLVGAIAAMATPPLLAAPGAGLTEDLAVGWVGLQLALLLRFRRTGHPAMGVLAGLVLGACAWAGPYNGLLAALVDIPLGLSALRTPRVLARTAAVGLGGLLLALPVAWAVASRRAEDLPGGALRAGLPAPDLGPERFRGGLMHGVDLLDPWLPAPLTGGVPAVSHTGYLGLIVLFAAVLAVARRRALWPWLAGALALCALALGPHLSLGGRPLRLGEQPLLGPAGLLVLALPAAGRITRWYRAAAVAGLLLAPLAARSVAGRPRAALLLAGGLLLDALLLAPLPWPLPTSPLPDGEAWASLDQAHPGAVLELPLSTSGSPPPGHWRDAGPLAQTRHGRPLGGALMGLPPSDSARQGQRIVQGLLREGRLSARDRALLRDAGFGLVALRTTYLPLSTQAEDALTTCLGAPVGQAPGLRIHALAPADADCDVHAP